jgi:hypothetical protein
LARFEQSAGLRVVTHRFRIRQRGEHGSGSGRMPASVGFEIGEIDYFANASLFTTYGILVMSPP